MPSETLEGFWIPLDTIDSGNCSPEPPVLGVGGAEAAALRARGRDAIPWMRVLADHPEKAEGFRDAAMKHGIHQMKFRRKRGKLEVYITRPVYLRVCDLGWDFPEGDQFDSEIESQKRGLTQMLSDPTKDLGSAELDFVAQMWVGRHQAWIRLVLNAVRLVWIDAVEDVGDVEDVVASMV